MSGSQVMVPQVTKARSNAARLAHRRRRVVEVAGHEAGAVGEAELRGEPFGGGDGRGREVDADDLGAALRQRQAVAADMALQVDQPLPGQRPEGLAELGLLDRVQPALAAAERREVVAAGCEVHGGELVPMPPVVGVDRRRIRLHQARPPSVERSRGSIEIERSAAPHLSVSGAPNTSSTLAGAVSQPLAWISPSSCPGPQPA